MRGGSYAWLSPSRGFILVVPCGSDAGVLRELEQQLNKRTIEPIDRLVVCLDDDGPGVAPRAAAVADRVHRAGSNARAASSAEWTLERPITEVSLVVWRTDAPTTPGVPEKQTLERIVCSAICSAYASRGDAVQAWLERRPQADAATHKSFAWSHMAGWYAEHGCDDFFKGVWRDAKVRAELELLLRATGAWSVVEAVAR